MFKIITIASGKGGVGKTSLSAGLSSALALTGKKVLVIDGDSGLRNLDIVIGLSDSVVFNFQDVALGITPLAKAIVKHTALENLYMLTAPHTMLSKDVNTENFKEVMDSAKDLEFDFVIIDSPAGIADDINIFASVSTQLIVISTPDHSCLRGAQKMASELSYINSNISLVVNRIRPKLIKTGYANNIDDAMDITGLPLLGIIAEDERVITHGNAGELIVLSRAIGACKAYKNIANRILDIKVPLMNV